MTTTIDLDDNEVFDLATGVFDKLDLVKAPGWAGYSVVVYRYNFTAEEVGQGDIPDDTTELRSSPVMTLDDVVAVLKAQKGAKWKRWIDAMIVSDDKKLRNGGELSFAAYVERLDGAPLSYPEREHLAFKLRLKAKGNRNP